MRGHHGRLQPVAPAGDHHDRCFYNGHDAATQAGYYHDPPTATGGHPAAAVELPSLLFGLLYPSAPPDLDCADVSGSDFTVLPPDPHRFDREGDGVGCES